MKLLILIIFQGDPIEEFRQEYSTFLKKGEVSKKLQKLTDLLLKPSDVSGYKLISIYLLIYFYYYIL